MLCSIHIVVLACIQELTLFLKPRQPNNHVRPCHPSSPRIMPDCLESNQCYVRRWRDLRSIWGDTAVPATIQFTPLLPPLKPPDTHVCQIMTKGGRKRKVGKTADFHGVALVSSSQGRQACRHPLSAKSALRRAPCLYKLPPPLCSDAVCKYMCNASV